MPGCPYAVWLYPWHLGLYIIPQELSDPGVIVMDLKQYLCETDE